MRCRFFIFLALFLFSATSYAQDKGWNVSLLGNWNDTAQIQPNLPGWRYSDVWGFVSNGREYAALASTEGVHIIDVNTVRQVAFYPGRERGQFIVHRDYKTYRNYLYAVCDEGYSTLQIFDLSHLPDSLHLVYESPIQEFSNAHNIFIDTAKATLYAASFRSLNESDHMRVYDISTPAQPVLIDIYNNHDKVHDVYVRNDTAWCSSSFFGLEVVDFSQHGSHNIIGQMQFYPYKGFNHSSWFDSKGLGVMADETHGMPVKVVDASDLNNIHVLSTCAPRPAGDNTCIPHNPYLVGDWVFISYYYDGFQLYNIADPAHPVQAGYYHTCAVPPYNGFNGAWGCYPFLPSGRILVSDMQNGLFILDVSAATGWQYHPEGFQVYPVPATDRLYIQFPRKEAGSQVQLSVWDATGKLLFSDSYNAADYAFQPITLTLPAGWQPGMYFIRIQTGGRSYSTKFTKL